MGRLTAACGSVLVYAVHARAENVWEADDPEAVQAFEVRDHETLYGRTSHDNVASQAVRRREWLLVADWLDAHDIGSFPDTPDGEVGEREEALAAWRDREYLF